MLHRYRPRALWLWLSLGASALACDQAVRLVVVDQGGGSGARSGAAGSSSVGGSAPSGGTTVLAIGGQGGSPEGGEPSAAAGVAGQGGAPGGAAGAAGAGPEPPIWQRGPRYTASFSSYAFPGEYLRYVGDQGFIGSVDMSSQAELEQASFEMIPGLYNETCVSFRGVGTSGSFFRHFNSRLYMQPFDSAEIFSKDATFCEEPGMADANGVTFRSSNYPMRVIHLRNTDELWIDDVPDTQAPEYADFAAAATFYRETPLSEQVNP